MGWDIENRVYFEHYRSSDSNELERWWACPCCEYPTLDAPGDFEICILCGWMDDRENLWNHKTSIEDARSNFRLYRTMYSPGSRGFELETPRDREHKEKMIAAYERYMAEKDLQLRIELSQECKRLVDLF